VARVFSHRAGMEGTFSCGVSEGDLVVGIEQIKLRDIVLVLIVLLELGPDQFHERQFVVIPDETRNLIKELPDGERLFGRQWLGI